MISIYDYLGKAGGAALGEKVNAYAQIRKQPFKQRKIKNRVYNGKVFLYTRDFLDDFFKVESLFNKK